MCNKNKKYCGLSFLMLIILSIILQSFTLFWMQFQCKLNMVQSNSKEISTLKLPKETAIKNHELIINGQYFDVVSKVFEGNFVIIKAIPDYIESSIIFYYFNTLGAHSKNLLTNLFERFINFFDKYCAVSSLILHEFIDFIFSKLYFFYNLSYKYNDSFQFLRPPIF